MTIKNVFLFEGTKEHSKHELLKGIESDKADEIIANGLGAEIDLSTYEVYQEDFDNAYDEFKQAEQDIKNSSNPLDQSEEMQAYLLDIAEKDFKAKSDELQAEYSESLNAAIKEAERNSVTATIKTTQQDETTAKQMSNRIILDLAATGELKKSAKVSEIVSKLSLISNAEKVALQSYATDILAHINDEDSKRLFIDEVMNVKDTALLQTQILAQVPKKIDTMAHVSDVIRNRNNE